MNRGGTRPRAVASNTRTRRSYTGYGLQATRTVRHPVEDPSFTVKLEHRGGYQFAVDFGMDGVPELVVDEPAPIGDGNGPPASRMLAAAAAQCLASSLIFCLSKARVELEGLHVQVTARKERDESRRLRIPSMKVRLEPRLAAEQMDRLKRCEQLFEDFCTVTQRLRSGIDVPVEVEVHPRHAERVPDVGDRHVHEGGPGAGRRRGAVRCGQGGGQEQGDGQVHG